MVSREQAQGASGDTDMTQYPWDHRNRLVKSRRVGALHPRQARAAFPVGVIACVQSTHPTCYWVRKAVDSDGDGHLDGRRIFLYDGN